MHSDQQTLDYYRSRAEREIALAKATGAQAHASADYRTVFIKRADGSQEKVRLPPPGDKPN